MGVLQRQMGIFIWQIVLVSSVVASNREGREHVHIKVHFPQISNQHTVIQPIEKHYFHPKKIVESDNIPILDDDTAPWNLFSRLSGVQPVAPFSHFPITSTADDSLEANILQKSRYNSIIKALGDNSDSAFHGMKKPSEFLGSHLIEDVSGYQNLMDNDSEELSSAELNGEFNEPVTFDQHSEESSYPYALFSEGSYTTEPSFLINLPDTPAKLHKRKRAGLLPSDWAPSTDKYSVFKQIPNLNAFRAMTKPMSSSSTMSLFQRHSLEEPWLIPKRKKSKVYKRNRFSNPWRPKFRYYK